MIIEEIKKYMGKPNVKDFIKIIDTKSVEIEQQIKKLKQTQRLLSDKRKQIELCEKHMDRKIHVIECELEKLLVAPYSFEEDDVQQLIIYIREMWGIEECHAGIGSYISVNKVLNKNFSKYDGLFTPLLDRRRSKGFLYIQGFLWEIWNFCLLD